MSEDGSSCEAQPLDLLDQFELILESDPLIDEVGYIHISQFAALCEDAGGLLFSSVGTVPQTTIESVKLEESKANPLDLAFWCGDHKLGISTSVLFPLYNEAKRAFMHAFNQYKMHTDLSGKKGESQDKNGSSFYASPLNILESEVLKHSRALLLLSCDFGTAWNSRKLVLSNKQQFPLFLDELLLAALILSYSPKSECTWSHRRWVMKMIAGRCSNLQEIVEKESELVKTIVEKSKMNYRAWNHRCWLVSYMSKRQVLHEFNKSRDWTGLHASDNSSFHYRTRLMLRMLEDSRHNLDQDAGSGSNAELCQMWKEELDWDEKLIKRYIGREALWLHRHFLSRCWIKHFATLSHSISCLSDLKSGAIHDAATFWNNELLLFHSCSIIPDSDFEDHQAQATFAFTYIMWLTKQISDTVGIELQKELRVGELKTLLNELCPRKTFLWDFLIAQPESI